MDHVNVLHQIIMAGAVLDTTADRPAIILELQRNLSS
jgi:hypothetical protein